MYTLTWHVIKCQIIYLKLALRRNFTSNFLQFLDFCYVQIRSRYLCGVKNFPGLRSPTPATGSAPGPRWGCTPRPLSQLAQQRFAPPRARTPSAVGTARFACLTVASLAKAPASLTPNTWLRLWQVLQRVTWRGGGGRSDCHCIGLQYWTYHEYCTTFWPNGQTKTKRKN